MSTENDSEAMLDIESDQAIERLLEKAGFRKLPFWERNWQYVVSVLIVMASILLIGYTVYSHGEPTGHAAVAPAVTTRADPVVGRHGEPSGQPAAAPPVNGLEEIHLLCEVFSFPLAMVAFVVGYAQWRAGRHEISLDKYYDRLDLFNQRLEKMPKVDTLDMLVYTQLDTLEYTLQKYKLNYVRLSLVRRAYRAFASSCEDAPFRNRVQDVIERSRGFEEPTRAIARATCELISQRKIDLEGKYRMEEQGAKEEVTKASNVQR